MIVEQFGQGGLNTLMLTEIYIEALLVDEELADAVWLLWNDHLVDDDRATFAWSILADLYLSRHRFSGRLNDRSRRKLPFEGDELQHLYDQMWAMTLGRYGFWRSVLPRRKRLRVRYSSARA